MGWDGVELAILDRSQVDLAELRLLLADNGLEVPMLSTGQVFAAGRCSFAAADAATRARAETLFAGIVEVAAELGAMVNVGRVRGGVEGNGTRAEVEERVAASLAAMASRAAKSGVRLVLEPVNRYEIDFLNSCDEAMEFLGRPGLESVGLMPDLFHMNIEDASIEGSLSRHAKRIGYVHFADSNRHHPGAGHLDFPSIIGCLRGAGYPGWIGVEILPHPDPDRAARAAIGHLRGLLGKPA
jgi:sugar phosphate isomerase/epimerase